MRIALDLAKQAMQANEVPVGAVIVKNNIIIAQARNQMRGLNDPTAHAEMIAIRMACQDLKSERLPDCDLYITLEPCPMCLAAISAARIRRIYYGASDLKSGGLSCGQNGLLSPALHHKPEIYDGFMEQACQDLLQSFFASKRNR